MSDQDKVPVVTHDGKAHRTTLKVDRSQFVTETHINEGRIARPFDSRVVEKLTPTMKKFSLEGRVAVVTG